MSRGQLVPDEYDRQVLPRPPRRARRAPTARSSTASRGRRSRPRRSTTRSQAEGSRVDRRALHRRPARGPRPPAWRAGGSARPTATCTTSASNPPQGRGRLRPRRLGARPARRRRRGDRPGADGPAARRRCYEVVDHYRSAASCATVDGRPGDRRRDRGARRAAGASADAEAPDDGHAQVPRRDRRDAPRRPHRRRGPRPDRGRAPAGRLDGRPRPHRGGPHPRAGRDVPSFKGYPGVNPRRPFPATRLHLDRRRDRPRDPGRADHPRGPDRLGRRGGHRRRLARRRRADLLRRRAAAGRGRARSTPPGPR